jgi:sorbitol-6-phosphate 2-dehydrogenase
MDYFKDKVCLITGGAQGLGKYLAERLADKGCSIIVCDLNEDVLKVAVDELNPKFEQDIMGIKADVSDEEDVKEMVEKSISRFGKIDFLVSNAALSFSTPIHDIDAKTWKKFLDVNLFGYFLCVREVSKVMIKNNFGSIVQVNSRTGKRGSAKNSAYAASKGGGIVLTQSLSAELAPNNIRVNCVCPGPIFESELWQKVLFKDYSKRFNMTVDELKKKYINEIPLGRETKYEDVANVVTFLLSDKADYLTGQALNVDGGTTVW